MSEEPEHPEPAVRFESTETEPRFVAAYNVAIASQAAFEATLQDFGNLRIPGNDRERESLRRISLYLGTLFGELHAASTQLSFMEMPRAQYVLNRQLIEYHARNRWFIEHKEIAVNELDRLPKAVHIEVTNNPGAFDEPARIRIAENYAEWAKEHPDLDALKHSVPGPTDMVKLSFDDADDMFWYYGHPSVIVHGKTHGIQDVLARRPDGTLERSPNSLGLNRVAEMHRATGFALRYGILLAVNFDLDESRLLDVQEKFDSALRAEGLAPELVTVKRYL